MKDLIRIVVIDPNGESRDALRRLVGAIDGFWVAEVLEGYRGAAARVAEVAPDLTIVALDHDPQQAVEVIAAATQANPQAAVLPASRGSDSALILRSIRAGAREFLALPAEPAEVLEIAGRLLRGREESQTPRRATAGSSPSWAPRAASA
jgi:pilus assembly protein CpaE